ncbi:hypothetical protein Acr_05g0008220 [Actinidia rufa]|uniref:Uncharacterized protein n=1 Tax=Actinidia rufa TaxID=165716 RepID=A0A7J0EL39_9ERIC|nr:hypothetical protein Acr_05g0008220 [Actinidia rufa]
MASTTARRLFQRSTASARSFLSRNGRTQSAPSVASGGGSPASRHGRPLFSNRLPVELGCGESLMPLHSATASALLKSMLSSKVGQWGSLSEEWVEPEDVVTW